MNADQLEAGPPGIGRVGTLGWAEDTGGRLRCRDRLALLAQAGPLIADLARGWVAGGRRAVPDQRRPRAPLDVDGPDTPAAHAALGVCTRISPAWLVRHCRRTYAYALAFARDRPFDTERLFVASMLHDAGLTDGPQASVDDVAGPAQGQGEEPCFAVRGARLADRLARTHGWSSSSRDRLAEAISLHLNVFARSRYGIEAEILSAASAFDAIRLRSRQVDREWVRTVEARWPRGQSFCDGLRGAWRRESLTHPDCRAAFLDPWGFFEAWIGRTCRVE